MEPKAKPEVKDAPKTAPEKPVAEAPEPVDARLEILPALAKKSEPIAVPAQVAPEQKTEVDDMQKKSHYDTLLQFAAVELGGTVQKKK
jgi:hypothetical protein